VSEPPKFPSVRTSQGSIIENTCGVFGSFLIPPVKLISTVRIVADGTGAVIAATGARVRRDDGFLSDRHLGNVGRRAKK